ncbi:MAG TPA: sigma-E factor negative regulatory protein [Ramlibacter sp.]|uniref:sigma-E factor negative regulatory protein n=1 Tax=Ramlibacter sp. TaxID=1917967 RepID=UPI002CDC5A42|nr:sigma-E factor negative regulatory protein [Ramlibacter sp.]HVZ45329.1 sigma-E factor negative regulatory protein [Ramlibacter sp.]
MNNMNTQELVSALADGHLEGDALAGALDAVCADEAALAAWHRYHLIGDVLRSQDLAAATPAERFLARLQESLRGESVTRELKQIECFPAAAAVDAARPAANDSRRWKMVAGVATLTAAAAIGWSMIGAPAADRAAGPQLAAAPAPSAGSAMVLTGSANGPMIRDEDLDRLLAAHRQFGTATALQTPAQFVRNAAFEGPAR